VIDFRKSGNSTPYLGFGWSRRESTHTWMAGPRATLWLRVASDGNRDHVLVARAHLPDASPAAPGRVEVRVNGMSVGTISSTGTADAFETFELPIPRRAVRSSPNWTIALRALKPGSDEDVDDPGATPLAVQALEIRPQP
jgi:hypothetical protein